MTRLIVKNLPLTITEGKLRAAFSPHGSVTDLQLKYNKAGKFRGFAFIGYKAVDEAEKAKEYLDNTYIGAAKVRVEQCKDLGADEEKVKKQANKSGTEKSEGNRPKISTGIEKYQGDAKFQEFAKAVTGKDLDSKVTRAVSEYDEKVGDEGEDDEHVDEEKAKVSDLDYLKSKTVKKQKVKKDIELFTVKISGLPYKCKKKDIKLLFGPNVKPKSVRVPPKIRGIAFAGFATEKEQKQALIKNKSFIGQSQVLVVPYVSKHKEGTKEAVGGKTDKWKEQEAALAETETVGESGRIFVRNLSYATTEEDLEKLFSEYGPLTETSLPVDRHTRKQKGFAFITFMMPEHAVAAFTALDGKSFQGRLLHLLPAKAKVEQEPEEGEDGEGGKNFKKNKELKQKKTAGSSHNWNSLFLGGSAVADVLAEQYGVDKADVVLGEGKAGKTAAVNLALGETQIVAEVRLFLEEQGVSLDAFSRPPTSRSKTVILCKNLPAKTHTEELRDLFSRHGVINRLVLPPYGLSALIDFAEAVEARSAFTKLAYTKFKNAPLYLEWAPDDAFKRPFVKPEDDDVEDVKELAEETLSVEEKEKEEKKVVDGEEGHEEGATLFVKNLNFVTTDADLRQHFETCGEVFSASVATKKDPRTKEVLSMGFGFITFKKKASSEKALKTMQHSRLADHCLELKRSERAGSKGGKTEESKGSIEKPSTKLLVRNIPFQATKEEVTAIFKTFGELSAVRLPRKMAGTGDHRGFAFVEFNALSDAKAAFKSLVHSTHLYGRRLVVEFASGDSSLEEMRSKTRKQWESGGGGGKKAKHIKIDTGGGMEVDDE